jgi:hypothetical protein
VTDERGDDSANPSPYPDPYPLEDDVVIRKPADGWSPAFYEESLRIFRIHRGHLPRSVKLHTSTVVQIMSNFQLPSWAPTPRPTNQHDRDAITLSDDE